MSTIAPPRSNAGLQRWATLGGVAYVVLFVVGVILIYTATRRTRARRRRRSSPTTPTPDTATEINIGWVLAGLGYFFFLWFLSALRQSIRRLEVEDGFLTGLATMGGVVYATLSLAALAVETGIRTMSDDTYHHRSIPGLIHAADDAGWVLHASGGVGLAAMIIAASLAALRARAVPTWAGWLGIVVGHPLARPDHLLPVVRARDLDPGREHRDVRRRGPRTGGGRLGMPSPGPFRRARRAFRLSFGLHRASTWSADASHLPFVNR